MRVALVHDYLSQNGGAEKVLKALTEIWPKAPIFVLFHDQKKITEFSNSQINETYLKKLPGIKKYYEWYLPFMPSATERHNLADFDIVISSTSSFAKGIITNPETLHICYCHTPPRFLWSGTHKYVTDLRCNFLIKGILPGLLHKMRIWDILTTNRVDHFISNSKTVENRIKKYYRRPSDVIHPPVAVDEFYTSQLTRDFFVAGGRLVPYKRLDLVIKAFNRLGWKLKIFGTGSEEKYLKKIAKPNIEFLGFVSEKDKAELLSTARALINPQYEDFGIVSVEAMASGRPVIAYSKGGAVEIVVENKTGVFFHEQTWESLLNTLLKFDTYAWDKEEIRNHAKKFSTPNFKNQIKKFVDDRWEEFDKGLRQVELIK